jgi:Zn-dependent M28 family amino/carboxypeptidase
MVRAVLRCVMVAATLAAMLAAGAGPAQAQRRTPAGALPPGVALPAPVAFDLEQLKADTRELSSDAYEGRAPGTPGDEKTVAFLVRRMQEEGLQPGNAGSWFQDVPILETFLEPDLALAVGGAPGAAPPLRYATDIMVNTRREAAQVALANAPVVFAGHGVHAPERGWDDYAGLDVRGKVVIVLVNDPDWRTPGLEGTFGGRAMTYYGRWDYKHDEAARRGAAAVLVVHQDEPAGYPWAVVQNSWSGPQLSAAPADGGASRPMLEGWISAAAADRLLQPLGGLKAAEAAAARPGFRARALPWTLSGSARVATRRFTSRNVIGRLPGRERPDEHVLMVAHWDHLGRCPPDPDGDDICNGAIDNATGTAALLAMARAFRRAGPPPARSLLFLAVTAEESGLIGSAWYAANPVVPLAMTVGGVNVDGLSMLGRTSDFVIVGAGKSELEALAARFAARQSRRIEPEPSPEKGFFYRSDHFSLAKVGVPMLYGSSGVDVRGKGREAGLAAQADYTANRYHKPGDEFDETWDWSGALEDLAINYAVLRAMAESRSWPNWLEGAEFKAVRDASRAGIPELSPLPERRATGRGRRAGPAAPADGPPRAAAPAPIP